MPKAMQKQPVPGTVESCAPTYENTTISGKRQRIGYFGAFWREGDQDAMQQLAFRAVRNPDRTIQE
jgi:hypothetical protein